MLIVYRTDMKGAMKNEINWHTGIAIKRARENAKITQEALSEILDCSPQYVSMLETGRCTISVKMLRALCLSLNISSDSILFPDKGRNSLDIVSYKCKELSDEQFRLLIEIINRYIEAVTL